MPLQLSALCRVLLGERTANFMWKQLNEGMSNGCREEQAKPGEGNEIMAEQEGVAGSETAEE